MKRTIDKIFPLWFTGVLCLVLGSGMASTKSPHKNSMSNMCPWTQAAWSPHHLYLIHRNLSRIIYCTYDCWVACFFYASTICSDVNEDLLKEILQLKQIFSDIHSFKMTCDFINEWNRFRVLFGNDLSLTKLYIFLKEHCTNTSSNCS